MAADPAQLHLLHLTSRTSEQAFDALKALPLWADFLPTGYADFVVLKEGQSYSTNGHQLFRESQPVYDAPEGPHAQVGVMFTLLIDHVDPTQPPVQERKEQLLDVWRALPDGDAALVPAHLGEVRWIKSLDGNHIVLAKVATPPHTYLGRETPALLGQGEGPSDDMGMDDEFIWPS